MSGEEGSKVLCVGVDDSNHANKRRGEVIVAVYSYIPFFGEERRFPNTRNHQKLDIWLDNHQIDYNYTLLTD